VTTRRSPRGSLPGKGGARKREEKEKGFQVRAKGGGGRESLKKAEGKVREEKSGGSRFVQQLERQLICGKMLWGRCIRVEATHIWSPSKRGKGARGGGKRVTTVRRKGIRYP